MPMIEPTHLATTTSTSAADDSESPARATSFGTFKPVGHVMVGLPDRAALRALKQALIDGASPLAGFGDEITLMRRYVELARKGTFWLNVKAANDEEATRAGELAQARGATLAVHYGRLTVEDLIGSPTLPA